MLTSLTDLMVYCPQNLNIVPTSISIMPATTKKQTGSTRLKLFEEIDFVWTMDLPKEFRSSLEKVSS